MENGLAMAGKTTRAAGESGGGKDGNGQAGSDEVDQTHIVPSLRKL